MFKGRMRVTQSGNWSIDPIESPIQGKDGVIFDARGKAIAMAECL